MKILITGATGFIGRRLCERLSREGYGISVLSRAGEKAMARFPFLVKAFHWDAGHGEPPAEAFSGVEAVIHLAGEGIADKRWSKARKQAIYDSRVLGTRQCIAAVARHGRDVKTFLSASAIGWYGPRGDEILDEDSTPGDGFLASVCRDWEKETEGLPAGIRSCSVRIGIVLGKDGGALKKLLPLFKLGAGGPVGDGKQWMSWIHIDDLVALFVFLLESNSASGAVNGVAPNPVTNREFSKTLGNVLSRPAFLPAPAFALKAALGELSVLVLDSQRILPKRAKELGFTFRYNDLKPALFNIARN